MAFVACPRCGNQLVHKSNWAAHRNRHQDEDRKLRGRRTGSTWQWRKLRDLIIKRDGGVCVRCSRSAQEAGRALEVHHVNGVQDDDRPENLETRCFDCHHGLPGG